jgi:hypothetical protein
VGVVVPLFVVVLVSCCGGCGAPVCGCCGPSVVVVVVSCGAPVCGGCGAPVCGGCGAPVVVVVALLWWLWCSVLQVFNASFQ